MATAFRPKGCKAYAWEELMPDWLLHFTMIGVVAASLILYGIFMGHREDREREGEEKQPQIRLRPTA